MRKIPFAGIELTSQRVRGLRGTSELPGREYSSSSSITTVLRTLYVFLPDGVFLPCDHGGLDFDI